MDSSFYSMNDFILIEESSSTNKLIQFESQSSSSSSEDEKPNLTTRNESNEIKDDEEISNQNDHGDFILNGLKSLRANNGILCDVTLIAESKFIFHFISI